MTTLGDIITEVRNRADLTNSQFITNEELTTYINYSLGELQGLIVNAYGGDYFATYFTGSITAGNVFLNMPNVVYKVLGVDLCLDTPTGNPAFTNNRITLSPFNFNERNRANSLNLEGYATQYQTNYRYKLVDQGIFVQPPAGSDLDFIVWYIPQPTYFVVADPLDLTQQFTNNQTLNGWLEYVVVDVALKCKQKEETDPSMFVRQKALLTERIRNEAQNRDQGSPARVSDIYAQGVVTDFGWDDGWGGTGWTY